MGTLAVLLLVGAVAVGAEDALGRLLEQLSQRQHGHVRFVERQFNSLLDRPLESSGELRFDAPDRLEKTTIKPRTETLILQHGVVTVQRGRRHYVLSLADHPQILPFVDSIRATLAGDRATLEASFHVTFESQEQGWRLLLVPRDARLATVVKRIAIEGSGQNLDRVIIERVNGDRSIMDLGEELPP